MIFCTKLKPGVSTSMPEDPVLDPARIIYRESDVPIDEIAVIAHLRQSLSQKDWDGFIETYGLPPLFLELPPDIPAKLYWSVTAYDNLTRSELHNGTPFSRISKFTKPKANSDGSFDLFFGPDVPAGEEANWIKTVPGKGSVGYPGHCPLPPRF